MYTTQFLNIKQSKEQVFFSGKSSIQQWGGGQSSSLFWWNPWSFQIHFLKSWIEYVGRGPIWDFLPRKPFFCFYLATSLNQTSLCFPGGWRSTRPPPQPSLHQQEVVKEGREGKHGNLMIELTPVSNQCGGCSRCFERFCISMEGVISWTRRPPWLRALGLKIWNLNSLWSREGGGGHI